MGGCGLLTTQRDFLDLSRTKRAPYNVVSLRVVLLVLFSVYVVVNYRTFKGIGNKNSKTRTKRN